MLPLVLVKPAVSLCSMKGFMLSIDGPYTTVDWGGELPLPALYGLAGFQTESRSASEELSLFLKLVCLLYSLRTAVKHIDLTDFPCYSPM